LAKRSAFIQADGFAKAKEIAAWKDKVADNWDLIEVLSVELPETLYANPAVGKNYNVNIVLDVKNLSKEDIGVELVITSEDANNKTRVLQVVEMNLVKAEGSKLYFNLDYRLERAGLFKYGFRMFPKNPDLPHRQDFCYVRWI
jgi:starch phosphorylase